MTGPKENREYGTEVKGNRLIFFGISLVSYFLLQPSISLAQWQIDPILRLAWDTDDNATLAIRTDQEEDLSGYIGEASVDFTYDTNNRFLSFRPMARTTNYGSSADRDSDDQFARLVAGFDGDKHSFRILGDYGRESVRTAELADAALDTDINPEDITDDQTGAVGIRERRERFQLSPRWSYRFSNISSMEADLSYVTVDFSNRQGPVGLFDYTDTKLRLAYRHRFSGRNSGVLAITARDYTTERFGGDRTGLGISTGFNRTLSETTQFSAQFGLEDVQEENVGQGTIGTDPNFVTNISVVRRLETIQLLAQYRQTVNASGNGELTKRDEMNLRFTRELSERISAGLGLRAYSNSTISGILNFQDQDYLQLRGQFLWRISRTFSMQADYRHTVIDRAILGEGADSNRFTLWFSYQPNPVNRDSRLGMNL